MLRVLLSLLVAGASLVACTTTTAPPTNCWIGLRGQYLLDAREGHDRSEVALTDAVRIISARLNAMGLAAFDVRTLPDFRIDVDLPPLANTDEIREVIVATGIIEFVPVPAEESVSEGDPRPDESDPLFGQEAIATAQRVTSVDGFDALEVALKPEAAPLLSNWTRNNVGNQLAIVVDGIVVSAPFIRGPLDGTFQLSGSRRFSLDKLATFLRLPPITGTLHPVGFEPVARPAHCGTGQ